MQSYKISCFNKWYLIVISSGKTTGYGNLTVLEQSERIKRQKRDCCIINGQRWKTYTGRSTKVNGPRIPNWVVKILWTVFFRLVLLLVLKTWLVKQQWSISEHSCYCPLLLEFQNVFGFQGQFWNFFLDNSEKNVFWNINSLKKLKLLLWSLEVLNFSKNQKFIVLLF